MRLFLFVISFLLLSGCAQLQPLEARELNTIKKHGFAVNEPTIDTNAYTPPDVKQLSPKSRLAMYAISSALGLAHDAVNYSLQYAKQFQFNQLNKQWYDSIQEQMPTTLNDDIQVELLNSISNHHVASQYYRQHSRNTVNIRIVDFGLVRLPEISENTETAINTESETDTKDDSVELTFRIKTKIIVKGKYIPARIFTVYGYADNAHVLLNYIEANDLITTSAQQATHNLATNIVSQLDTLFTPSPNDETRDAWHNSNGIDLLKMPDFDS